MTLLKILGLEFSMQMDFVDCVDREDLEPWKELTSGKLFPRYSFYFKNMANIF